MKNKTFLYCAATSFLTILFTLFFYWMFIAGYTAGAISEKCDAEVEKIVGDEGLEILTPTEEEKKSTPGITGMPRRTREFRACIYSFVGKINDPLLKSSLTDTF